jgi:hypothetical protein
MQGRCMENWRIESFEQGSTGAPASAPAKIGTPGPGPAPAKILEIWPGISSSNLSNSFYYCLIIVKIHGTLAKLN